jgi:GT2 family glycosyltransferase
LTLGADTRALYQDWIRRTEPSEGELIAQAQSSEALGYRPLFSFITQISGTSLEPVNEMIASLRSQSYPHWELWVASDPSSTESVSLLLAEYATIEKRVRSLALSTDPGTWNPWHTALKVAQGEFGLLAHPNDHFAPNLLYEVANLLQRPLRPDIVYFDEDKLKGKKGRRTTPWFKPNTWSPELLLSTNYLAHAAIRMDLLRQASGPGEHLDDDLAWDLSFRCTEKTARIVHLSKVLCHCSAEGRKSTNIRSQDVPTGRQLRSIEDHLARAGFVGPKATVTSSGTMRVSWAALQAKVSIIIPTRDKAGALRRCLQSIRRLTTYPDYEILLIDNGSSQRVTHDLYASLGSDPSVHVIEYSGKFNYSAANNLGARHSAGQYILFLNNDVEVLEGDWLRELAQWAEVREIGAIGGLLLYPNRRIQHAGVVVGMEALAGHVFAGARPTDTGPYGSPLWYRDYMAVTGACMMIRRDVFEKLGGFDEKYVLAISDVELCQRIVRAGYRIFYTPYARLIHREGLTRGTYCPPSDQLLGFEHMKDIVREGDPYFSPNLSYSRVVPAVLAENEEAPIDRLRRYNEKLWNGMRKKAAFPPPG